MNLHRFWQKQICISKCYTKMSNWNKFTSNLPSEWNQSNIALWINRKFQNVFTQCGVERAPSTNKHFALSHFTFFQTTQRWLGLITKSKQIEKRGFVIYINTSFGFHDFWGRLWNMILAKKECYVFSFYNNFDRQKIYGAHFLKAQWALSRCLAQKYK